MDDDLDILVFSDEDGKEVAMRVLDYFYYNGEEYAVLAEADAEKNADGDDEPADVFFMKVVPLDDEQVEFEPVDDALADQLFEVMNSELDDEDGE